MPKKRYSRPEDEQCAIYAEYLRETGLPFIRIETNIPTKNMAVINRLKREGWKAGYADYLIMLPIEDFDAKIAYCGLFNEIKRIDGQFPVTTGKDPQHDFLLTAAHYGYASFCSLGAQAAIQVTENYRNGILKDIYMLRNTIRKPKKMTRCYNLLERKN